MPSVTIPPDVFERLEKRAAALNITVEQLIVPLLDRGADSGPDGPEPPKAEVSSDEWKKKFDAWMADVKARAQRYPPGFVMDDSRESIYRGCGE
jgi:hypothetical protein